MLQLSQKNTFKKLKRHTREKILNMLTWHQNNQNKGKNHDILVPKESTEFNNYGPDSIRKKIYKKENY